jgi:ribose transport system permease protein
MTRLVGVLVMVLALYIVLVANFDTAQSWDNHQLLARRLGFYGVLTLGVGVLIVAGGIDLSIGSVVGLGAVGFAVLLEKHIHPAAAAGIVVLGGAVIGVFHGLLVTQLKLQPFLVTLCGLFIYRGLARILSDKTPGLGISDATPEFHEQIGSFRRTLVSGREFLGISNELILLLILAAGLAVILHATVWGRYFYAIGANEQAARYAGIATDRYKILAYVICSTLAGLGGVLYLLENRTATPSNAGSLLELYAITGAVLGGCSLRGGEGTIPGMVLGAAVLPLLSQICNFSRQIGSELEYAVIGAALLLGTIASEVVAARGKKRA